MTAPGAYTYAVGKVKVLETRLVDFASFQRMIDAPDYEEALRHLTDSDYSGRLGKDDYESTVASAVREANIEVASFSPDPYFTGMFYAEHDFLRLKASLKGALLIRSGQLHVLRSRDDSGWIGRAEIEEMANRAVSPDKEGQAVSAGFPGAGHQDEYIKLSWALSAASDEAVRRYAQSGDDPLEIDTAVDRAYFAYVVGMAASRNASWAFKIVAAKADMANILLLMRAMATGKDARFLRSALVPGGSIRQEDLIESMSEGEGRLRRAVEGSPFWRHVSPAYDEWARSQVIRPFEMAFDRFVSSIEREARMITEGYVPLMGYLLMKQREASIIRRILAGKAKSLPPKAIKERLSEGNA